MILNNILAAKMALSHEHHSFCLNDIKFRLTLVEIMSIVLLKPIDLTIQFFILNLNS